MFSKRQWHLVLVVLANTFNQSTVLPIKQFVVTGLQESDGQEKLKLK
jgi:hypothetical protein